MRRDHRGGRDADVLPQGGGGGVCSPNGLPAAAERPTARSPRARCHDWRCSRWSDLQSTRRRRAAAYSGRRPQAAWTCRSRHHHGQLLRRATGRPRDVFGAPHEKPAALEAQLDAAHLGYGIVGLVLVAIVAYRRAVALASACLDRRRLWPPMWPPWRDSGREGERAARPGAHIDIRDGQREAVEV